MDPLLQYKLASSSLFVGGGTPPASRQETTPFYVKTGKTSAEIIEEAKATMAIKSAEESSLRAAVRTVDTKRPFTPRQTDRRLYYGSTNHVARPPSSFRLLPLPEEELSRPVTAPRLTSGSRLGSPGAGGSFDYLYGGAENRLPVILPHINLTLPVQQQQRKSPKDAKRTQFRASSLCDVIEVSEQTEPSVESRTGETRAEKATSKSAASGGRKRTTGAGGGRSSSNTTASATLLQQINHELNASWPAPAGKPAPVRAKSVDYGHLEAEPPQRPESSSGEYSPVGSLLASLKDPHQLEREEILAGLEALYKLIAADVSNNSSGRPKSGAIRHKSDIIKTLCLYVDTESPRVLILVVQILLALGVRKQNLATAYKLTYKVARDAENDIYFLASEAVLELLVNSIGGACPTLDAEALVYGYGGLKFLTMNPKTREQLKRLGILELLLLHLKLICQAKAERRIPEETSHVLFQLTGVVRNLVNDMATQRELAALGGIRQICRCLELFIADLDVVCNISRTLREVNGLKINVNKTICGEREREESYKANFQI